MFKYYIEIEREEHMLYSKEIAELYGFIKDGKAMHMKVVNIIKEYIKKHDIKYNKIYYNTRNGLKQVFPREIYHPAILEYLWCEDAGGKNQGGSFNER